MNDDTTVLAGKFCEALRSGRWKQTYGKVRDPETGGVCATEVLCHVSGKRSRMAMYLDPIVNPVANATFVVGGKKYGLVGLNDIVKATFPEIADMVEDKFHNE